MFWQLTQFRHRNYFEHIKHRQRDYVPQRVTDSPVKDWDVFNEAQREARVKQIAARLERGECLFHPDEQKKIKRISLQQQILGLHSRGFIKFNGLEKF